MGCVYLREYDIFKVQVSSVGSRVGGMITIVKPYKRWCFGGNPKATKNLGVDILC